VKYLSLEHFSLRGIPTLSPSLKSPEQREREREKGGGGSRDKAIGRIFNDLLNVQDNFLELDNVWVGVESSQRLDLSKTVHLLQAVCILR
jgi:hypothetical protein